jgi:ParB-like chromosome segregation protein Spo0J
MNKLSWHTEQRKISDLIPYEHNPRQITDKQTKDLKRSLEKFNLAEIPAINTDNTIIAGHQRLKIMQLLGRGEETIDTRVPNRLLDVKELREYCVRSNKNSGEWDFDKLAENFEMEELKDWGFDEKELFGTFGNINDGLTDLDEVPELPSEPKTKPGDLYILGEHRLLCGDSTNPQWEKHTGKKAVLSN